MTEIEWNGEPLKDGVLYVDLKDGIQIKEGEGETALHLKKRGVDGYIDGNNAFKIVDPNKEKKVNKLNVTDHTTIKKGGSEMSNTFDDNKYYELKEDLRESERRITQDIRDRELRFEKTMEKHSQESKEREERFMKNIEEIKSIVSDGEKNRGRTTAAMWTLAITTIIGIAAMVITVVVSV